MRTGSGLLELRDRAYRLVAEGSDVTDEVLLAHVYGGMAPEFLRPRLLEPLLADPRLLRGENGRWATAARPHDQLTALTALALIATGPSPQSARLVRLCALHLAGAVEAARFDVTVHPGKHVPRYAAERSGLAREALNELPAFDDALLDDLLAFVGTRPIVAQ